MDSASEIAIDKPRLWRLALEVDGDWLHAQTWSTVDEGSLSLLWVPLNTSAGLKKALEEAVYAAPVLLSDFAGVDVVVRTTAYTLLPRTAPGDMSPELSALLADPDAIAEVMAIAGADDTIHSDTAGDADVLWAMDRETDQFLARTFRNPRICCHITPLIKYTGTRTLMGNSAKTHVNIHGRDAARQLDIIIYDHNGALALATTKAAPTDNDVLYHIFASMKVAGLDPHADEIVISGDTTERLRLMPLLRRYAAYVMPAIFPSAAFRGGRDALKAPFPLIVLPLCE